MFSSRRVIRVLAIIAAFTLIVPAATTSKAQNPSDVLLRDAREYAISQNTTLDEAVRRLELQKSAGDLQVEISVKERNIFAGMWIQHAPQFRIIVQLTSGGLEKISQYIATGPLNGIVDVRSAPVALATLEDRQITTLRILRERGVSPAVLGVDSGIPVDSGINVMENQVELYVLAADWSRFDLALQKANIQLPDHVQVVTVSRLSTRNTDIYAGLGLSTCTSGFSVSNLPNGGGTKGITTAGHCSGDQSYYGTALPLYSEWYYGSYDLQWHTAPGFTVRNYAADPQFPYYRSITATKGRDSQVLNELVCKYGKTTGYSCGYIADKNYAPSYVPNANPTFIRVHRDGVDLSRGGDSGGPWYNNQTAYGIHSGEPGSDPNDSLYMPINYVSECLLYVLTQ